MALTKRAVLVGALGLVLVASGAGTTHPQRQVAGRASCPATIQSAGYEGIGATAKIVEAVRRGVPRIFRNFTTQGGGPGWHHYQVIGLYSLNRGYYPEPAGIGRYRRAAMHRCGRTVALDSWVTFLQFPEAPMASVSSAYMFVGRTRQGWVAWSGSINSLGL